MLCLFVECVGHVGQVDVFAHIALGCLEKW